VNIAAKYAAYVEVPVKAEEELVLTIASVDTRSIRLGDGTPAEVDMLVAHDEAGSTRTVRLNAITVHQLVRLFGPETDAWKGKRVLVAPYTKTDGTGKTRCYHSFAHAPAAAK
jgi:hypothetical protein